MKDGTKSKTRKGQRQIISVSLPLSVFDALEKAGEQWRLNRSDFIAGAISEKLSSLGIKVGEP